MHTQLALALRTSGFSGMNGHKKMSEIYLFFPLQHCQGNTLTDDRDTTNSKTHIFTEDSQPSCQVAAQQ